MLQLALMGGIGLFAILLAGCGDKSDATWGKASQVAATVNKHEITVHQVNQLLQTVGPIAPDQSKRAASEVLERLIDQELLVQQAQEKKLDRSVPVLEAIEAAKREIYSRAYLEQVSSTAATPDQMQIAEFYSANPDMFMRRKIYTFEEVDAQPSPEAAVALQQWVVRAKGLDEVVAWLQQRNIPWRSSISTKTADELPADVLPRLVGTKPGEIALLTVRGGVIALRMVDARDQPMDLATATPFIERIIVAQRKAEAMQAEVARLRGLSSIQYAGDFAGARAATATDEVQPESGRTLRAEHAKAADDHAARTGPRDLK